MKKHAFVAATLFAMLQSAMGGTPMKENDIWTQDANDKWLADRVQQLDEELHKPGVPVWVRDVSGIMPGSGFETHCKRWVEGLDAVLYSVRDGCCYRSPFGRYGDNTASSLNRMEEMAGAVQSYLDQSGFFAVFSG